MDSFLALLARAKADDEVRGGGITIAISCDMIVADAASTFGYPEINIGLLFKGRTFSAEEAMQLGLASRLAKAGAVSLIGTVLVTDDCKEGLSAYVEKRKAVWKAP